MSTLAAALAWAARGFRIFPLHENSKEPLDVGWTTTATTDPAVIRTWWTDPVTGVERNYNIGCLATDWIIPDVDTKRGKVGLHTMAEIGLEFDTLTVATPSGGYHLYYQRLDRLVGQGPLGRDIDVRSYNGYVVAPGSIINGVEYRVVIDDPIAPFPEHLRHLLSTPRERLTRVEPDIDLDQPEFLDMAKLWLQTAAPKAVEGQNGDDVTFRVACRVRDYGVGPDYCFSLMEEHWNPTCSPPWEAEELRHKVDNAYRYAKGIAGSATPAVAFADVEILEPPDARFYHGPNGTPYHFGGLLALGEIEARPWIFGSLLMTGTVTAVFAGPGAGKSLLKLILAAHMACGKDFLGHKCHKAGKAIVFDGEDDVKEQSRRLHGICSVFGLDLETVRKNVCLVSPDEIMLQLTEGGKFPMVNRESVGQLIETLKDPEIVMLAIGPLAELHQENENDNVAMRYVMGILRMIAQKASVAVFVDHHTAKPPVASSQAWVGDQFAGRGASAIPGSARRIITMYGASQEDCATLGVRLDQRGEFVRLDDGKVSYGLKGGPLWLRWTSVHLWNGDEVGVLAPYDVKDSAAQAARALAGALIEEMRHGKEPTAMLSLDKVIGVMMRDPLTAREGRTVARNRLERALADPVTIDGVEVSLSREAKGLMGVVMR